MNKKKGVLFALIASVFALSFMSNLVSAYWGSSYGGYFGSAIDSVVRAWEPIFGAIFGGFGWNGMYLFERVLLFLVLMIFVYLALMRVPMFEGDDKKTFRWVIAIIVPLIGIRWIDYQWLTSVIVHYTFLAVLLTAVLPFLLYFFFVYNIAQDYSQLRKIMWVFFIGIYAGLWQTTTQANGTIYMWTVIIAIACLFLDGLIMRRYRALQEIKQGEKRKDEIVRGMQRKIDELQADLDAGRGNPKIVKDEISRLLSDIKWARRQSM